MNADKSIVFNLCILAVCWVLPAAAQRSPEAEARQKAQPAHIAKIRVNRDGVMLLNGRSVTIDALRASLLKLGRLPGAAVWYHRENPAGEPHPNAMLVLKAIVEAKLPVRLSTKPDFSDVAGGGNASGPPPR
jgi:hypothetical protein